MLKYLTAITLLDVAGDFIQSAAGLPGALCAPEITGLLGIRCYRASGLAAGVAGHGIATARILSLDETAGAFAGLAIGLCGLLTAVLLPVLFHVWGGN